MRCIMRCCDGQQRWASRELQKHLLPALCKAVEEKHESPVQALGPELAAPPSLQAHRGSPASQQLLPSLHAALEPAISGGSAHPSAGQSLRAIPWARLHLPGQAPSLLPSPCPPSHPSPASCRDPLAPCLHPCSSRSPPHKPHIPAVSVQRGQAVCKGRTAWASAAEGCSFPEQHQEWHQAYNIFVLPSQNEGFFVTAMLLSSLTSHPSYSFNFSPESPISIFKIVSGRYLS